MSKFIKATYKRYIASVITVIIIACTYNILNNGWSMKIAYGNGLFIGGFTLVMIGCISLVTTTGSLDIFSYMFSRKTKDNGKKEDLYEYSERMVEVRKKQKFIGLPSISIGLLTIGISALLTYL